MGRRRVDFIRLLPDDLLKKIVLQLPVESVVCLGSTCKKWYEFVIDEELARLHLDGWRSRRYGILYTNGYNPNLYYHHLNLNGGDTNNNKVLMRRLEECFTRIPSYLNNNDDKLVDFWVEDSCDGLLLIVVEPPVHRYYDRNSTSRLVVCNPLMKSLRWLQPHHNILGVDCHWKMVYDASTKRYKIIGITRGKVEIFMNDGTIWRGRRLYILELSRSYQSEWKEVCVCDDELGVADDFGGQVEASLLVDDEKKIYYITCKYINQVVKTCLIYIDMETYGVKVVPCPSLTLWRSGAGRDIWVAASTRGRFFLSSRFQYVCEVFNLYVLEHVQSDNPIWKRHRVVNRGGKLRYLITFIQPLEVHVQVKEEEEEDILYLIDGKIYKYDQQTTAGGRGHGLWRLVSNDTEAHHFTHFFHQHYPSHFSVTHLHTLILI